MIRKLGLIAAIFAGSLLLTGCPGPDDYVSVCANHQQLCLRGVPFIIQGATAFGQYDNAANEVALAQDAGLNVLELVNFEADYRSLPSMTSEATWTRVDQFVAAAGAGNLHVILNLSGYGWSLKAAGQNGTTTNWNSFLSFVANRTNTVSGVKYKNDPTIAMVKLWGEIDAPNYSEPHRGTTQQVTDFFSRTLAQWRALSPYVLVSTGGFSYINDPGSGIDWQTIVQDPNNAVCDVEINSQPDRDISVPAMSYFCGAHNKPWFLAAWSSCLDATGPDYEGDINHWPTDGQMALHAADMYATSKHTNSVATSAAAGNDFWNLGAVPATQGSCDIGPQFPSTYDVVQGN